MLKKEKTGEEALGLSASHRSVGGTTRGPTRFLENQGSRHNEAKFLKWTHSLEVIFTLTLMSFVLLCIAHGELEGSGFGI